MRAIEDWFASRGWQPFDFQREAWQAYEAGSSGLLHAPTGIGKTYAVWLGPIIEWLRGAGERRTPRKPPGSGRAGAEPIRVLWLTPMRALASDTAQALAEPVRELDLPWSIELRTGDTSSSVRARQRTRLPTALVTTPESVSIELSRPETRDKLATLRCCIVDEWHELLGTKRGVQTELALARLRQWHPQLRVWGLSATLGNLEQACDALLGMYPTTSRRLIRGSAAKRIEIETLIPPDMERFPWAGHLGAQLVPQLAERVQTARSTLCFVNTRSQAEEWFRALQRVRPDWLGQIALHHGSLDPALRRKTENLLRTGRLRCVVCTSSLDLGVDFSPVDQVVQVGSPKGIARLMQRAGRSGHQPGAVSRVICVPTHALELVEFAAAREALSGGRVEAREPVENALDVLAQHVVTVAAGGGFTPDELLAEIRSTYAYQNLTTVCWSRVLEFVERGGPALAAYPDYARVTRENGAYRMSSESFARRHRLGIGTITSDAALTVRTVAGGMLGTIEEAFIARLRPGARFLYAGQVLELVRVREMTAQVRRVRGKRGMVPRWMGGRFPLSTQLGSAVRDKLAQRPQDRGPEMRAVAPLLELQARWSAIPADNELLIEHVSTREGDHWFCYPFEGRLVHEGLGALLAWRIATEAPLTVHACANDYGVQLTSHEPVPLDEARWRALLSAEDLEESLRACVHATQMARRQFRDIARIAGLLRPDYPGARRAARHLQASSELFFDVFEQFDPANLLLEQARREVFESQLEGTRLRAALRRVSSQRIRIIHTRRLTPLAFPLWAERMRAHSVSTEQWAARVQRMVVRLEKAAGADKHERPSMRS